MRVVGAGLGRTGTLSLKTALERLLGAPCYHMYEVVANPGHVDRWQSVIRGQPVEWDDLLAGYEATVDWPAAAYYRELAERHRDAIVLLSTRPADDWWRSAARTIFASMREGPADDEGSRAFFAMTNALFAETFAPSLDDEAACKAAFERHNEEVRAAVPRGRLLEWQPGDGWVPICAALDLPVPDEPFPHTNTSEEFQQRHTRD